MGARPKMALRPLSQTEQQALQRVAKASSERVDAVKRAKAVLAVAEGKTLTQAGQSAQLSREGVSQLVQRFNERGLAVLVIAPGRGRKPTYDANVRARVLLRVCNGSLIERRIKRPPGPSSCWSTHYVKPICLLSGRRPLDGSYMRKATACSRTALGVTRGMRYANAKTGCIACAIPRQRKKKLD
jgi:transposase